MASALTIDPDSDAINETERSALNTLHAARLLFETAKREDIRDQHLNINDRQILDLLHLQIADRHQERVIAIFADSSGHYIRDEIIASGAQDQVAISLRRLVHRALDLDARKILLAHNHPSGCAKPSDTDVACTQRIHTALANINIELVDHLIVGGRKIYSIRQQGLI